MSNTTCLPLISRSAYTLDRCDSGTIAMLWRTKVSKDGIMPSTDQDLPACGHGFLHKRKRQYFCVQLWRTVEMKDACEYEYEDEY